MDQNTEKNTAPSTESLKVEDVLCRVSSVVSLEAIASYPKPLEQIGFTGLLLPDGVDGNTGPIEQLGLRVYSESEIGASFDLADFSSQSAVNASDVWSSLEQSPGRSLGVDLTSGDRRDEATTLLQVSINPVPIIPMDEQLLYSPGFREQREFLRSAVFWRKRFEIARYTPNLVHAGVDGLLIYSVDSWLVSINQNAEEASIDLGSHGSMWLMLGTQRDVHLHGSMLILPPFTGAVVANELAR